MKNHTEVLLYQDRPTGTVRSNQLPYWNYNSLQLTTMPLQSAWSSHFTSSVLMCSLGVKSKQWQFTAIQVTELCNVVSNTSGFKS